MGKQTGKIVCLPIHFVMLRDVEVCASTGDKQGPDDG